jgi:2,3-dihydroxybenzoate-AMP ligase
VPPAPLPSGLTPWPEATAQRYRDAGLWQGRTLGSLLREWAAEHGERTALVGGERLSYAQLDAAADRMAAGLRARGIAAGDRVVVQLPNVTQFAVLLFGLLRAGAIPVLTLPAHRRTEIVHLAQLSEAVAYVIADEHAGFDYRGLAREVVAACAVRDVFVLGDPGPFEALAALDATPVELPEPDPADIALLLVSGGTTAVPKLIPRTHDDYALNARASAAVCGLHPGSVYLAALPVAHNFALACPGLLGTLGAGGTVVFAPSPAPGDAFALIASERVTLTALVPPLIPLWIDAAQWDPADLSSLQTLQAGGSKLPAEVARAIGPALGCRVQQVFGMAEGLLNYTRPDDDDVTIATSQGRPLCVEDELRIVDADGADVEPGATGELLVRGPYTIRGYLRAPTHNATAFTPDGYYCSGDLVRALPSGHLVVEGRVNDTIHRGGESISAEEIEHHVLAHPAVRRAAAIGLPDTGRGEEVCAVVVSGGEAPTLRELRAFLMRRGVAAFKLPDRIELVDELPVTAVGKIDKRALVQLVATRDAAGA